MLRDIFLFFLIYFLLQKDQVGSMAGNPWEANFFFEFLNFILFMFLYSRFLLVIHFIHISVYMGDIFDCQNLVGLQGRVCDWHLVGGSQGYC